MEFYFFLYFDNNNFIMEFYYFFYYDNNTFKWNKERRI